ncbi:MAG: YbgA family protein [Erysipelothrix sp.]
MSFFEEEVKMLISDNIFYYISDRECNLKVRESLFSNREISKIKKYGFNVYTRNSMITRNSEELIRFISFSDENIISIKSIDDKVREPMVCMDVISDSQLEVVYNNLMSPISIYFKDKRAARMQMLKETKSTKELEKEWGRYKYLVMEYSQKGYDKLRKSFACPNVFTVDDFYTVIFEVFSGVPTKGSTLNSLQHVWGYFKKCATPDEQIIYLELIEGFDSIKICEIKEYLYHLTLKYDVTFLKNSYYF